MVSVLKILDDFSHGDARMDGYFLMRTPLEPMFIIGFYLAFVTKIGPKIMEKRQPFNLKPVLIAYNLTQIVFNSSLAMMLWNQMKEKPFSCYFCYPRDLSHAPEALLYVRLHYYYILIKVFDLFDTMWIVLRKKKRQISYMHLHHHVGIFIAAWISGKYFPAGQAIYTGLFNCLVHSVMYFYYLLTSLDSKNIWWKKYVTAMQIVQQGLIITTGLAALLNPNCPYPKVLYSLYLLNVLMIMSLFIEFYVKNYKNNNTIVVKKSY